MLTRQQARYRMDRQHVCGFAIHVVQCQIIIYRDGQDLYRVWHTGDRPCDQFHGTASQVLDHLYPPKPYGDRRPCGPEPIERWEVRSGSVFVLGYRYDDGSISEIVTHFPRPADPADWPDLPF